MIYTVICDISAVDEEKCKEKVEKMPFLRDLIKDNRNKEIRKSRIGAYLTLKNFYEYIYNEPIGEIKRNYYGKPYFKISPEHPDIDDNSSPDNSLNDEVSIYKDQTATIGAKNGTESQTDGLKTKKDEISIDKNNTDKNINSSENKNLSTNETEDRNVDRKADKNTGKSICQNQSASIDKNVDSTANPDENNTKNSATLQKNCLNKNAEATQNVNINNTNTAETQGENFTDSKCKVLFTNNNTDTNNMAETVEKQEKSTKRYFNVSHDGEFVAVTLSDVMPIGVDIQEKTYDTHKIKIIERFLKGAKVSLQNNEDMNIQYLFSILDESADPVYFMECDKNFNPTGESLAYRMNNIKSIPITEIESDNFEHLWTTAEATLKANGKGFYALEDLATLAEHASKETLFFDYNGERYTLTTAYINR